MSRCSNVLVGTAVMFTFVVLARGGDEEPTRQKVHSLEARSVRIVDKDGRARIELTTETNSHPVLWLYDGDGTRRLRVATTPGGAPMIGLFDKAGKPRASLSMAADGSPHLEYFDATTMPRVALTLEEATGARLTFSDHRGAVTWEAPVGVEGR